MRVLFGILDLLDDVVIFSILIKMVFQNFTAINEIQNFYITINFDEKHVDENNI